MNDLSISLQMPPELAGELQKHSGLLAFVKEAFPVLDDSDTANYCATERKNCLEISKQIKAKMDQYTAPAEAIIEQARADFKPAMDNAKAAADYCGTLLLGWDAKEKARIAVENRAREEAERKIWAEAEAKAAAIRAKAEEQAREDARKATEAAEALRKAQAEGNAKEAAKLAAANAKATAEAEARAEQDRIKAAQIEAEAAARAAAMPIAEAQKVEGFSGRSNWKAEYAPGYNDEAQVLMVLIEAISKGRTELLSLITLDMTAANKAARAYKQNWNCPGLRAVNKAVATSK